jgi:hypothetical protein
LEAELLMPRALFSADARHRPICFDTVEYPAGSDMDQVSRTTAAWRLIRTTSEPCALVTKRAERFEWVARSEAFAYWIPERGQPVGSESVAAAILRGEAPSLLAERVAPTE